MNGELVVPQAISPLEGAVAQLACVGPLPRVQTDVGPHVRGKYGRVPAVTAEEKVPLRDGWEPLPDAVDVRLPQRNSLNSRVEISRNRSWTKWSDTQTETCPVTSSAREGIKKNKDQNGILGAKVKFLKPGEREWIKARHSHVQVGLWTKGLHFTHLEEIKRVGEFWTYFLGMKKKNRCSLETLTSGIWNLLG
jgi:hypothetical protein